VSVGHIARLAEEAGIPTVIIASQPFRRRLVAMNPPRVVITPHLMGRPLGAPGDTDQQRRVLRAALDVLASATHGNTIIDLPGPYHPHSPLPLTPSP